MNSYSLPKPRKTIGLRRAMDAMHAGARLVAQHTTGSPNGIVFYVIPGGHVSPETAEKIKQHPLVRASHDGLFPGQDQTWKIA